MKLFWPKIWATYSILKNHGLKSHQYSKHFTSLLIPHVPKISFMFYKNKLNNLILSDSYLFSSFKFCCRKCSVAQLHAACDLVPDHSLGPPWPVTRYTTLVWTWTAFQIAKYTLLNNQNLQQNITNTNWNVLDQFRWWSVLFLW